MKESNKPSMKLSDEESKQSTQGALKHLNHPVQQKANELWKKLKSTEQIPSGRSEVDPHGMSTEAERGRPRWELNMASISNLVRITALIAFFVSIPLTLRPAADYLTPSSSPEMRTHPNVTSFEVFHKDMGWQNEDNRPSGMRDIFAQCRDQRIEMIRVQALKSTIAFGALLVVSAIVAVKARGRANKDIGMKIVAEESGSRMR